MLSFLASARPVTTPLNYNNLQAQRETLRSIGLVTISEGSCDEVAETYRFMHQNHMLDAYVRNEIISSYPSL